MQPLSNKRMIRIEKKKKKMAALLEISKLNEYDRANKNARVSSLGIIAAAETEPSAKRLRTETHQEQEQTQINSPQQVTRSMDDCLIEEEEKVKENIVKIVTYTEESEVKQEQVKAKSYSDELSKLKKLLREKAKKMRDQPSFRLREYGELASLSRDFEVRMPLFLSDIQHLLLFSQLGVHSPYTPARWCQLEKQSKVAHTNLLIIENLSTYTFSSNESQFPFLSSNFNHKLEVVCSQAYKADLVQDISMVPITGTQLRKFINQYGNLAEAVNKNFEVFNVVENLFPIDKSEESVHSEQLPTGDKFPRTQLLLSGWQLIDENFPLPIKGLMDRKYSGYVLSKDRYKAVTPHSPMFGIDCEMCRTESGELELTRVSVVDENMQVFYEQLVKPDNKIVDYLTKYSGITAKMLKNIKKRLPEVQEELRKLLPADSILVGQSLSNDMHALKMMHPYVIDTSVIYNLTGNRNRKSKLQTLTRCFLNERIQEGHGHCSVEDSRASLKLVQHKLENHLCHGDLVLSGIEEHFNKHPELGNPNYASSLLKHTTWMEKTAQVISLEEVSRRYEQFVQKGEKTFDLNKINCISESSNTNVIKRLCDTNMQYTLNIAHVRIPPSQLEKETVNVCKTVDGWVKTFHRQTSTPSLNVVLFTGLGAANGCCFVQLKKLVY